MKTSKLYFFVVAFLALSISMVSCSGDDGEAGLIGPKGDQGEQGVAGPVGPAGDDGSQMYSGEGEPEATVGVTGDYYLDIATGMLYGPKQVDDSWADTDGFSLMGAAGTNGTNGTNGTDGADGSQILSGEGVPTADDGEHGDFYLDKETAILYGPKNNKGIAIGGTGWGAGLELKGADGNANVKTYKLTINADDWNIVNNVDGRSNKYGEYELYLETLTEDVYENGIILVYWDKVISSNQQNLYQLPKTEVTESNNIMLHRFYIIKNTGNYRLWIKTELIANNDSSELLDFGDESYKIKLVTGQAAVQLIANKDNQLEFDRLVDSLED
ncbi:MAG: collagen-like protein [Labilibaculum sp.]|nr:hypothetical protein [Labilibaculum sp.]MBI9056321.1 collagen-like protein [Labilibaculum sp.]